MIGFSASFAKTISIILHRLESYSNKVFQHLFDNIVAESYANELYYAIDKKDVSEVIEVLKHNGFGVEDLRPNDEDSTILYITW